MRKKKYDNLKTLYPQCINKSKMLEILDISPYKADYLIEHGILPVIDTKKRTHRYLFNLDDIITYMRRREQWENGLPPKNHRKKKPVIECASFRDHVTPEEDHMVLEFFTRRFAKVPEVMRSLEVSELLGISLSLIRKSISNGRLKSLPGRIKCTPILIPKPLLLDFVASTYFINIKSTSEVFKNIVKEFELWKTAK